MLRHYRLSAQLSSERGAAQWARQQQGVHGELATLKPAAGLQSSAGNVRHNGLLARSCVLVGCRKRTGGVRRSPLRVTDRAARARRSDLGQLGATLAEQKREWMRTLREVQRVLEAAAAEHEAALATERGESEAPPLRGPAVAAAVGRGEQLASEEGAADAATDPGGALPWEVAEEAEGQEEGNLNGAGAGGLGLRGLSRPGVEAGTQDEGALAAEAEAAAAP